VGWPRRRILGWAAALPWLLAGCATPVRRPETATSLSLEPRWQSFRVSGRITAKKGEDAFSGSFRWAHLSADDALELLSPFGQTVARLERDSTGVRLHSADGRTLSASDWESLTQTVLGWPIPVSGLTYWIQAAAIPEVPYTSRPGSDGRLEELRQQGWTVRYGAYDERGRPTRLQLEYVDLQLRLAVDTWDTGESRAGA
jgi:outer membrane lipoprotein LolB